MDAIKMLLPLATVFFVSCTSKPNLKQLEALDGYWEIEKVLTADGKKEFSMNETIDHFAVKGFSGIRTKVRPQFDGSFVQGGTEEFTMKDSANSVYLVYQLAGKTWAEELVELSEEKLILKNARPIEYHFKRHEPFSVK